MTASDNKNAKPICVIKIGGTLLTVDLQKFWIQAKLRAVTHDVVVVHGGGVQSTNLANRLGHQPQFVHGRRITGALDLKISQWAVRGEANTALVSAAVANGISAAGLSGVDLSLVTVTKRPTWHIDGEAVEFGHVGDVVSVDGAMLFKLVHCGIVPVVASLGVDTDGNIYNVNADTIAMELAVSMEADELIMLTESGGLTYNQSELEFDVPLGIVTHDIVKECNDVLLQSGLEKGWISGGMGVKIAAGLETVRRGVGHVRICGVDGIQSPSAGTKLTLSQEIVCGEKPLAEVPV